MYLVAPQCGVAVRLDPHASHGVVKDLVVLDEAQACGVEVGGVRRSRTQGQEEDDDDTGL